MCTFAYVKPTNKQKDHCIHNLLRRKVQQLQV